ncbi:zinc/manganese transport system permease protein [Aurantimicrobium minutum]|uniref:metal ABC transporter permease n=1 Tax=Aurantimicrobium minutum TaxID=708131 RepID=UPI0024742430|nr:metal ABC transporter permease [Aurantimicrobium minutum]MDH6409690.1 zinc/manganese transport system permease protein [Aurantimicrobium minutum]MDH6423898.1 zinc/manganese transport system permease protein [Aurantimicrobium minutum]
MDLLNSLFTAFTLPFMGRALVVLIVLSLAAGIIGVFINLRGLEFLSDGLTHAVFPGLAAGFVFGGQGGVLIGALIAAAAATIVLTLMSNNRVTSDATTAIVLTAMFSIGVIIVSASPGRAGGLEQLLFGHLLTVTDSEAITTAVVAGVALVLVLLTFRRQVFHAFDPEGSAAAGYRRVSTELVLNVAIALVIVAASNAVGNLLVLAVLIVPGALSRLVTAKLGGLFAVAVGAALLASWIGLGLGFNISVVGGVDVPAGATVALSFVAFYAIALVVRVLRKGVNA